MRWFDPLSRWFHPLSQWCVSLSDVQTHHPVCPLERQHLQSPEASTLWPSPWFHTFWHHWFCYFVHSIFYPKSIKLIQLIYQIKFTQFIYLLLFQAFVLFIYLYLFLILKNWILKERMRITQFFCYFILLNRIEYGYLQMKLNKSQKYLYLHN